MNEQDQIWWAEFRESTKNYLTQAELQKIAEMHAHYKRHKFAKPCTCNPKKIQSWINDLNEIYIGDRAST